MVAIEIPHVECDNCDWLLVVSPNKVLIPVEIVDKVKEVKADIQLHMNCLSI